jgi:hypothetical protein
MGPAFLRLGEVRIHRRIIADHDSRKLRRIEDLLQGLCIDRAPHGTPRGRRRLPNRPWRTRMEWTWAEDRAPVGTDPSAAARGCERGLGGRDAVPAFLAYNTHAINPIVPDQTTQQ